MKPPHHYIRSTILFTIIILFLTGCNAQTSTALPTQTPPPETLPTSTNSPTSTNTPTVFIPTETPLPPTLPPATSTLLPSPEPTRFINLNIDSWAVVYMASHDDRFYDTYPTQDGGIIAVGFSESYTETNGRAWVVKLNRFGGIEWQRIYGDERSQIAYKVFQTKDGNFWVWGKGRTESRSWVWSLKLDPTGEVLWHKTYEREVTLNISNYLLTQDGGVILLGATSQGINADITLIRVNSEGDLLWQKTYGGFQATSIGTTQDGGFVVSGYVGKKLESGISIDSAWIFKVDGQGELIWQKFYNFPFYMSSIHSLPSEEVIVTGLQGDTPWYLKLDSQGNIVAKKSYTQSNMYVINGSGYPLADGGVIFVLRNSDGSFVQKIDAEGNLVWQSFINADSPGIRDLFVASVTLLADNSYLVSGYMHPTNVGVNLEPIIFKLNPIGLIPGCTSTTQDTTSLHLIGTNIPEESPTEQTEIHLADISVSIDTTQSVNQFTTSAQTRRFCEDFPPTATPTPTLIPPPAETPSPLQIYPLVGANDGILLGGVQNNLWLDAETTKNLLTGGENYFIFDNNQFIGEASGSAPLSTDGICAGSAVVPLAYSAPSHALAVGGTWNLFPRNPVSLPLDTAVYQTVLDTLLQENGLTIEGTFLTAIYRVDLEGDGTEEAIISATHYSGNFASGSVKAGDFSVVVVRKLAGNEVLTIPLLGEFYSQDAEEQDPHQFQIAGIMDLNGDGTLEIVIDSVGNLTSQTHIYESTPPALNPILVISCRDFEE